MGFAKMSNAVVLSEFMPKNCYKLTIFDILVLGEIISAHIRKNSKILHYLSTYCK
jgi:hypothetical protein